MPTHVELETMSKPPRVNDRPLRLGPPGELVKRKVRPMQAIHLGEDPGKLHPFRVQLLVQTSALLPDKLEPAIYYVKGPKRRPDLVLQMADQLWQKWEKFDKGIVSEYPDTRGHGFAEVCDEQDFMSAWHDVKKYQLQARVAGDPDDPMAFTCVGRTDL